MSCILGMIIGMGMAEWRNPGMRKWYVCEFGMLECWNSGGCAELGNLYILTIVVVMTGESN